MVLGGGGYDAVYNGRRYNVLKQYAVMYTKVGRKKVSTRI
jgi:hypothetical protein